MSKAAKIVLIIVAVLVAIGAAIGIYFAVKGKNPYTKEQQAFIDEIINSNKPNNPPVDIGGGTFPGGVIGEDETGDTVIVDKETGSDDIWQKDPTDPDGGYDKVETPTTDDEGQPFTYQTVVQVCGSFALVKNDVGNHAVINLAESKVVLNYTDLQDAENLQRTINDSYLSNAIAQEVRTVNLFLNTIDWDEIENKSDEECKEISDRLISTSHRLLSLLEQTGVKEISDKVKNFKGRVSKD